MGLIYDSVFQFLGREGTLKYDRDWGVSRFPDGQQRLWIVDDSQHWPLQECRCSINSPAALDILLQFLQILDQRGMPGEPKITLTYLYGGRSDTQKRDQYHLCHVPQMIDRLIGRYFTVLDPHCWKQPFRNLQPIPGPFGLDGEKFDLIIFPDESAAHRFGSKFNDVPRLICGKERNQETGEIIRHLIPAFDALASRILIADDICDGGRSFLDIPGKIGAWSMELYVTHGLFTNGALQKLIDSGYRRIWTTNSYNRGLQHIPDWVGQPLSIYDVWS